MSKSERTKIKDTNLGKWLKDKAPSVLDTVGDLLPDKGALGVVKNLLDKEPNVIPKRPRLRSRQRFSFRTTSPRDGRRTWEATSSSPSTSDPSP